MLDVMAATFAKRVVHIDSTSSTFAALIRVWSLSGCITVRANRHNYKEISGTYSDVDVVVREDESSIRRGKLGVRHSTNLANAMWVFISSPQVLI